MKTESDDLENTIFTFEWWRDSAGYEFTNESRSAIRRKGGAMESYSPDKEAPMLYRDFMALGQNSENEVLAFINKYGFLGTSHGGSNDERETMAGIMQCHFELMIFDSYVKNGADDKEKAKTFNGFAPAHMELKLKESHGKLVLQAAPSSLVSWIWLRIAQEAVGDITERNCLRERCQKAFYIGKGQGTKRKKFCSDHCRAMFKQENDSKLNQETSK